MAPVDRQQIRLYTAQIDAFEATALHTKLGPVECTGLVNSLFTIARERTYWKSPVVPAVQFVDELSYEDTTGCAAMAVWYADSYEDARIEFKPTGRRAWIVAHEVAHILLQAGREHHRHMEGHGPEYAAVFIWSISALYGKKWSNRLKRAFANLHVESICSLQED
jgi:hypothetical protein